MQEVRDQVTATADPAETAQEQQYHRLRAVQEEGVKVEKEEKTVGFFVTGKFEQFH